MDRNSAIFNFLVQVINHCFLGKILPSTVIFIGLIIGKVKFVISWFNSCSGECRHILTGRFEFISVA